MHLPRRDVRQRYGPIIRQTFRFAALAALYAACAAFSHQQDLRQLARQSLSQLDGTIVLPGLKRRVEVIRDRWGVPHIYAQNTDDLFFAQGFVQAQDRLWQMDMYRRRFEGRLSELLGPSALRHDRLVRLLHYRGPWDAREYGSYHPEARRILTAFAKGVNAFMAHAGENLPVEFKVTGLRPQPWTPEIALLRTQTAMPVTDARNELTLARNVARYGAAEANRRYGPQPYRDLVVPEGTDVSAIDSAVVLALSGMLRDTVPVRPELLPQYRSAKPEDDGGAQENSPGSNNWVVSGRKTVTGKVLLANDPHRSVGNPSIRYIVHLNAPGWNLIGATEPPLPGVMIGHNGRIGWGLTILGTDQSDVYIEKLNPANHNEVGYAGAWEALRIVRDTIRVQGQRPLVVEHRFSRHGPVFHIDSVRHLAYAIRSTMHEPGTAGYLSALRYHAVDDCHEFLAAQVYYKAPTENMICGDVAGNIAWHASGLAPERSGWDGRLPVPGTGKYEWRGFRTDLPRELNPERGWIATANHDVHPPGFDPPLFFKTGNVSARYNRIAEVLSSGSRFTIEDFKRLQHDAYSASAAAALRLFRGWTAQDRGAESARAMLASWNAIYSKESAPAALYYYVDRALEDTGAREARALETALTRGLRALEAAQGRNPAQWRWGRIHRSQFRHALVRAFDIAPVERAGGSGTVAATGATYRQIIDFSDFDRSVATNAPGQSGQPNSAYYDHLAVPFGAQTYFPLGYSRAAVLRNAAHRLILLPK